MTIRCLDGCGARIEVDEFGEADVDQPGVCDGCGGPLGEEDE